MEKENIAPSGINLIEGQVFCSELEAKQAVKNFCETNYVSFRVDTNNKQCLKFCCKNGGRIRGSKTQGERIHQHYNQMNCPALVRFYKSKKDGSLTCTKIVNEHSHAVTAAIYNRDNVQLEQEEIDLCLSLKSGNCKPSQIKRVLQEKYHKEVTIQKLKNMIKKFPAEDLQENNFEEFLTSLEDEGGNVNWLDDPDGTVRCMAIYSSKMKNAFHSSDPPLVQLDTTFEIEASRYKLMAVVYLNPTTNKSEVAFMALMCDETTDTVDYALKCFKSLCLRQKLIFIVDKDFGQLAVLSKLFPGATILLCIFHAIKFIKTLVATAPVFVERKTAILKQFRTVLYSNTEADMCKNIDDFLNLVEGVEVKTGDKLTSLKEYFKRNWLGCKEMWVIWYRKDLPCLGDNTSNRVERYFWTLKKALKDTFMSLPKTVSALKYLVKFADERLQEKYTYAQNKVLVIYDKNELIVKNNQEASKVLNDRGCVLFHSAQKKLEKVEIFLSLEERKVVHRLNGGSKVYSTTLESCDCMFVYNHQAPCSHILFMRVKDPNVPVFSPELFHKRYLRESMSLQSLDTENVSVGMEDGVRNEVVDDMLTVETEYDIALSDRKKYAMVMPILIRLGNLISCHPTKMFLHYLDRMNDFEKRIRRGQNLDSLINDITAETLDVPDLNTENRIRNPLFIEENENVENNIVEEEEANVGESENGSIDRANGASAEITNGGGVKRLFDSITFKESLRTKGRPRKKSKQFVFNKGKADRQKNTTRSKPTRRKKKDLQKESITDSESSEDETAELDDSKGGLDFNTSDDEESLVPS